MKKLLSLLLLFLATVTAGAQMVDPVHMSAQLKTNGTAEGEIIFTAKIDPGWHIYSTDLGSDGPIAATLHAEKLDGVVLVGKLRPEGHEIKAMDNAFGMVLRYFENSVRFVQKVKFTKPNYTIDAYLEYGVCNDEMCMPPQECTLKKSGKAPAVAQGAEAKAEETPTEAAEETAPEAQTDSLAATDSVRQAPVDTLSAADKQLLWQPVVDELKAQNGDADGTSSSLWYLFVMGLGGGLLALLTPCVWPIIPMTVSFFLKRSQDKRRAVRDAVTYGLSIVVIFLLLAFLVTMLFTPSKLNELATNAVFNVFFFLLLLVFAFSFFGWFELELPSSWGNKVDSKASQTTGLLSIFLMAFTLVLVSFSCTAPIVGLLLVEAATSGNWVGPALGMLGFALALALPFTLFALFPSWLKRAPKSGSWMNTVKVVLGFIELAFSLKFLSVADLAYGWHILDREVFLSLWIIIFAALGCYLVGWLKFRIDEIGGEQNRAKPVWSIMLGLCSLAFALYMVPGLWGAPCKAVSAFAPPMSTQDFNLNHQEVRARYTDYDLGMAAAKAEHKPVLIDFTGFGCVNCRKMEAAVWTDPTVAKTLQQDYVLISLFVDDKTRLKEPITVQENGREVKLRTVGDKWSYFQRMKFGANTQPFYVPIDNDGRPLCGSYSYNESISDYLDFLKRGTEEYRK